MPNDPLRNVFASFEKYLCGKNIAYSRETSEGVVISIRVPLAFPKSGTRLCRLSRFERCAHLIVRVGHYKPRRLAQIGTLLEELTDQRIEVSRGRMKWVIWFEGGLKEDAYKFGPVLTVADEDISSVVATMDRIVPLRSGYAPILIDTRETMTYRN